MRMVEERTLREDFRRGERAALLTVYQVYAPPLFGFLKRGFDFQSKGRRVAFRGCSSRSQLECTVQEVFARAFAPKARMRYDGLRPYKNYLFAIARHVVIDAYRQRTRDFAPLDDIAGAEIVESPMSRPLGKEPDAQLEDRQLRQLLEDFAAGLTEMQRAVLEQRFRKRSSIERSAQLLGVSEHRIKKTERWLRRRLFHTLRRHGYLEGQGTLQRQSAVVGLVIGVLASGAIP